jgi:Rieske Fe-S protein
MAIDARADVYALGVILFALLSGTQPFKGSESLEIALQRLQQPVPSLHTTCLDVPEAFDLVIGKMLERDPAKRTQYASDAATAFERVVKTLNVSQTPSVSTSNANAWMQDAQITIPPTVNWFDEEIIPSDSWQAGSPAETHALSTQGFFAGTGQTPAFPAPSFPTTGSVPQANNHSASLGGTDPFLWWSSASTGFQASAATPGSFANRPPLHLNTAKGRRRPQPGLQDRRNLTKLLITGGVAAGVVTIGGISLARIAQSQKPSSSQIVNTSQSGSTPGAQNSPTASNSPTSQPTSAPGSHPSPTVQPKPTATQAPPRPTPTPPPGHTGTVIGHTSQATNTAVAFTNPADGQASWLVHMGNGNFVACEQACTHARVPVKYDASSGQMVCPAHGATFNADGTNPSSPAPSQLPKVTIRVNGDGTITTG